MSRTVLPRSSGSGWRGFAQRGVCQPLAKTPARLPLPPGPSAPSVQIPRTTPRLGKGKSIFPWSTRNVVYDRCRERSPRDSKLPCSRRHACMNNRSSPDAERLLCNFSRRLESLSRVLAEVTAYLSYSGLGETDLCRWR